MKLETIPMRDSRESLEPAAGSRHDDKQGAGRVTDKGSLREPDVEWGFPVVPA